MNIIFQMAKFYYFIQNRIIEWKNQFKEIN